MQFSHDLDGIQAALSALGSTEAEVVNSLQSLGIQGCPSSPEGCPVAQFLNDTLNPDTVMVDQEHISMWFQLTPLKWDHFIIEVPDPVSAFISDFDRGNYPDLEAGD